MHNRILLTCGLLTAVAACSSSPSTPETTLQMRLQIAMDDAMTTCDGFGASAALAAPGEDLWIGTSGVSHGTVPVTPEMLFGIASTGKAFVATLVFMLVEDGSLSLDDSLSLWLPPYSHVDSSITVRQLLGHTSGLDGYDSHQEFWDAMGANPSRVWSPEELLETFLQEPRFAPGTTFDYANTNYVLLGLIIERVTGAPYATVLRNRILDPLGLNHTFLMVDEPVTGVLVHPWWDMDEDGVVEDLSNMPPQAFYSMAWPSGSMVSTARDLVTFSTALFGGALVRPASLAQMLEFHPVSDYGLGLHRWDLLPGVMIIGHRGGTPISDASMEYLPDHGIHFAVILNWRGYECNGAISAALVRTALDQE
jgi:D-alanyl-D-alanine carboxypeptidase